MYPCYLGLVTRKLELLIVMTGSERICWKKWGATILLFMFETSYLSYVCTDLDGVCCKMVCNYLLLTITLNSGSDNTGSSVRSREMDVGFRAHEPENDCKWQCGNFIIFFLFPQTYWKTGKTSKILISTIYGQSRVGFEQRLTLSVVSLMADNRKSKHAGLKNACE
jgi:hypothetical protein